MVCVGLQFLEKFNKQNRMMMEAVSDIVDDVKAVRGAVTVVLDSCHR